MSHPFPFCQKHVTAVFTAGFGLLSCDTERSRPGSGNGEMVINFSAGPLIRLSWWRLHGRIESVPSTGEREQFIGNCVGEGRPEVFT